MNRTARVAGLAVMMGVFTAFLPARGQSADLVKIGVVDMVQVGLKYDAYQSELKKLQKEKEDLQRVVDKEEKEIMVMVKAIQEDQALMEKEELKKKKSKIEAKDKKLVDFVNETNKKLRDKRQALDEKVKGTIHTLIREIAQRDGLSVVLEKNFIIYNIPEIDITDEVVKGINEQDQQFIHKSRKKFLE